MLRILTFYLSFRVWSWAVLLQAQRSYTYLLCMCVLAKSKPEGKNRQSSRIQHSFIAEKQL